MRAGRWILKLFDLCMLSLWSLNGSTSWLCTSSLRTSILSWICLSKSQIISSTTSLSVIYSLQTTCRWIAPWRLKDLALGSSTFVNLLFKKLIERERSPFCLKSCVTAGFLALAPPFFPPPTEMRFWSSFDWISWEIVLFLLALVKSYLLLSILMTLWSFMEVLIYSTSSPISCVNQRASATILFLVKSIVANDRSTIASQRTVLSNTG